MSRVTALIARLGLTDEEVLAVFDIDPLGLIADELDHRPELEILLLLTAAAAEQVGEPLLRRWLRASGPAGPPIGLLRCGDFAGFEDALGGLLERGLILGGGGGAARPSGAETPTDGL